MKQTSASGVSCGEVATRDTNVRTCVLLFASMLCLFIVGCGEQRFGPMTLREVPTKYLFTDASYPAGGGGVSLGYSGGSKCGTFSELQASVNGVALHLEESGGKGNYDHDRNEYQCKFPGFSLPRDTRIPPNVDGKHVLVVSDPSASLLLESTDWYATVSATIRSLPPILHRDDVLTVDFAPQGDEFKISELNFDFVDENNPPSFVSAGWQLHLDGWSSTVSLPIAGYRRMFANWQRYPLISRCEGLAHCTVWSQVRLDLGVLRIQ